MDGMAKVPQLVERAVFNGQPALALTDHGVMSGTLQLYRECKKHGILPFPGSEVYVVNNIADNKARRYHLTLFARNLQGFRTLVKLSSLSHRRDHFNTKPRLDFADLAQMADAGALDGLVALSGCYFGLGTQALIQDGLAASQRRIQMLDKWFPHLWVEIQHHNVKRSA